MESQSRFKSFLDALASLAVVVLCAVAVLTLIRPTTASPAPPRPGASRPQPPRREPPLPTELQKLEGASIKGSREAPVGIIEYSDFECPFCGSFAKDTWPELDRQYVGTGKVLFAFRHLPLQLLHASAFRAAEAAECAEAQGKFWPMHDALFLAPKAVDLLTLRQHASRIGIDVGRFESCLGGIASAVKADMAEATKLGITGTPTFFVGTVGENQMLKVTARLAGAAPIDRFKREIDRLLSGHAGQDVAGGER